MSEPTTSYVYFIQAGDCGPIKIGFTNKVRRRLQMLQTGANTPLHLRKSTGGGAALERRLHRELDAHRLQGEWFSPSAAVIERMEALPWAGNDIESIPLKSRPSKTALHAWRIKSGLTIAEASGVLGICQSFISSLENGKFTPGWPTMRLIFNATDGAVTPNDFADFLLPIKQKRAA